MALKVSLAFSLLLVLSTCGIKLRTPKPTPTTLAPGTLTVDPLDCRNFYVEDARSPIGPYRCEGITCFNLAKHECTDDKDTCNAICKCGEPSCAAGADEFIDPEDCHSYYVCANNGTIIIPYHLTCKDGGSYFNGDCDPLTKECTNICHFGCLDESEFSCPAKGNFARCPYTCDPSYFSCDGPASAPTIEYCPFNLVFTIDPQDHHCVKLADCSTKP